MIRSTIPEDTPALVAMTEGTGLFLPIDLQALAEVLADYHPVEKGEGHRCVTYEQDGQAIGFAYYAPTAMTDRTWHLWWIVVSKQIQARGVGTQLLKYVEDGVRAEGGRLLIVE